MTTTQRTAKRSAPKLASLVRTIQSKKRPVVNGDTSDEHAKALREHFIKNGLIQRMTRGLDTVYLRPDDTEMSKREFALLRRKLGASKKSLGSVKKRVNKTHQAQVEAQVGD